MQSIKSFLYNKSGGNKTLPNRIYACDDIIFLTAKKILDKLLNKNTMKPQAIIHEIVIPKTSTFFQRQLHEITTLDNNSNWSVDEQLEEACWNGLLKELFYKIVQKLVYEEKLFLWQVEIKECNVRVSLGSCFTVPEECFCLASNIFLSKWLMN